MSRGGPYDPSRAYGVKYENGAAGLFSDAEKSKLYGNDASYYGAGATRTKANSTLFVRNAPSAVAAEGLFGGMPGYIGVRQVRRMLFVDFVDVKAATNAMVRFQGHRWGETLPKLVIDYDKDTGKAGKKGAEQAERLAKQQRANKSADYYCCRCGTKALKTCNGVQAALRTNARALPLRNFETARARARAAAQRSCPSCRRAARTARWSWTRARS